MPPVSTASIRLPARYRVTRHIANGGMASVWEARDELLGRDVAVKLLGLHLTEDPTARMRFEREARAAAGLSGHPNVVTIYDVGEFEGRSFIVMELMRGSVAEVMTAGGAIAVDKALRWLREAGSALDAAHEAGIIHRDVKPANMLLDQRERLALGDFGIARLAYEDQVTTAGMVLGTSSYLSPEQALGEPASAASDRYALAAVAFELLTGTKPFIAEHFAAQARAHIEDPPPAASQRRSDLDPALDPVLQRGMAKEADERWPTAGAFVAALEAALPRNTPPARMAEARRAAAAAPAPERAVAPTMAATRGGRGTSRRTPDRRPRPKAATVQARPPGRKRWGAVALAASLLVLAGTALAFVLASGGDGGTQGAGVATSTPDTRDAERPGTTATAEATPDETPTPRPRRRRTPTPTAAATATPATTSPDPATAAGLNNQGFALFRQGRYDEALPPLKQAYELCQGSRQLDPCGYATYNYGAALRRSGDAEAAVPILEERMRRFGDNQSGDVAEELAAAREASR